jgi:L-histidine N-alpha-methyltransferase
VSLGPIEMAAPQTSEQVGKIGASTAFANAVRVGLLGDQAKTLPCEFIYDAQGSQLFDEICALPEYYPSRCEIAIIEERSNEIAALCDARVAVVEMGAGSATKTRLILNSLKKTRSNLKYLPIDISAAALQTTAEALRIEYPNLVVIPVVGDYKAGLRRMAREGHENLLVLWLGTSIGNVEPDEAVSILRDVRNTCKANGLLVLGVDLKKHKTTLERAYNDTRGVTARFNLNLLARINRELGGHFNLEAFEHRAIYNGNANRIEMYIVSRYDQNVAIDQLGTTVGFAQGEAIHTENSYKFSKDELGELARRSGFRLDQHWCDRQGLFSVNVLRSIL